MNTREPPGVDGGLHVDLPLFRGPFRLLATLVFEEKVDVCDVPVARVTSSFLEKGLVLMHGWTLEENTWFVATCASLLELKVGRLLPRHTVETEEDLLGGTPPDLLFARSLELAAFRRMSEEFATRLGAAARFLPRETGPPAELVHLYPDVLQAVSAADMAHLAAELFRPEPEVDLSHVTAIRVSLADAVKALRDHMELAGEATFRDMLAGCQERIEVVIRFLALLELHREGKVELEQAELFGDISVRWQPRDERPPVAHPQTMQTTTPRGGESDG
jgi:segregation and condensation protein A